MAPKEPAEGSGRRTGPVTRAGRRRAGIALFVGLAVSVAASIVANMIDEQRAEERFNERMLVLVKRFEHDMVLPLEILHGLAGLFEASDEVTRAEFQSFAAPALQRHPNVSALFWAPRVVDDERAALVARVRAEVPDFEIVESMRERRTAPRRDVYHPIVFAVPKRPRALGLDLGGNEERAGWLESAYDRGLFITPRIELPAPDGGEGSDSAVGAFVPVIKGDEHLGIVAASFRMHTFVEAVFTPDELSGVELMLYDHLDEGPALVYSTTGDVVPPHLAQGRFEQAFTIGNRRWSVVFQGTERLGSRLPAAVMIFGTIASVVVALLLFLSAKVRALGEGARRLGQYELLEVLGEGGMGTVYRAKHMLLRRPTAVKVIRAEVAARGSVRERFEREVQSASELSHPNNIVVYDYGHTPDGELYYAMEFVEGIDLHRLVQKFGPQPPSRVAHTVKYVASALAEAHDRGIVHRDIKPANIMLARQGGLFDFPKVLDFGLALTRKPDQREITLDGTVLGTPHFMAPEQGLGAGGLGPAADVYALGCVAYYMLTGHNLFEGATVQELVDKHMTVAPVPLDVMSEQAIDPELEDAITRCLEKSPLARPTAPELAKLVASCAAKWTNEDAAAWWEEHLPELEERQPSSAHDRVLTVRLHGRAATPSSDKTITQVDEV
jgi:serine/threonine-protein kinase